MMNNKEQPAKKSQIKAEFKQTNLTFGYLFCSLKKRKKKTKISNKNIKKNA